MGGRRGSSSSSNVQVTHDALKTLSTPVGFAMGILGLTGDRTPYPWQAQALENIAKPGTTVVRSPNGGGRSSVVVPAAAIWWLAMQPKGSGKPQRSKVAITTADTKQLNEQVIPALDRMATKLGWKAVRSPYYRMDTPTGSRLIAFCTDDAGRVEGMHGSEEEPLLWCVDEAKTVKDQIFEGVNRCGYQHLLVTSSAGIKQGYFYDLFNKRPHNTLCITAGWNDCPHIPEEKKQRIIEQYGETHPFTRSCIFGEFMDQDENESYLISVDAVERCLRNPPPYKPGARLAFVDFGAGKSENVIVLREGNRYTVEARWKEGNKLEATTRFIQHFRRLSLQPQQITGDAADAEMLGYLAEAGWGINRQSFGAPAYDKEVYTSWSAEAWIKLCAAIEKCEVILPDDPDIIPQLTRRKRTWNLAGKQGAENKRVMAENGIPSPDIGDCLAGAHSIRTLPLAPARDFGSTMSQDWNILSFIHATSDQQSGDGQWAAQGTGSSVGGLA